MPFARRIPIQIPVWQFHGSADGKMPNFVRFKEWLSWDEEYGIPVLRITNANISKDVLTATPGYWIAQDQGNKKVYPIDREIFEKTFRLIPNNGIGPQMAEKIVGDNEYWRYNGSPDIFMPEWVDYEAWSNIGSLEFGSLLRPNNELVIPTNEGPSPALPGSVIMQGVDGEVYPIPYDIFKQRYKKLYWKSFKALIEQYAQRYILLG